MEIIGLSGYARTGKDEFAAVLVEEFNFVRVGFADKLREVLYQLNPIVRVSLTHSGDWDDPVEMSRIQKTSVYVQDVINTYGWDGYKETQYKDEIRRLLQRLGTEAGRQTLWDSIWVDAAFAGLNPDARVVVTDTRFPNEADAVRQRGGTMLRIERPGVGPINNHPSETSLDDYDFDYRIQNDGSLEDYKQKVRDWMNK